MEPEEDSAESVYTESSGEDDEGEYRPVVYIAPEAGREDDYTSLLAQSLTPRQKFFVMMCYVRESGLYNMITESARAAMAAHYAGVYLGLLRFPSDYYSGVLGDQALELVERWVQMSIDEKEGPIRDVEQQPHVEYRPTYMPDGRVWSHKRVVVEPQHSSKSRAFGPKEYDDNKQFSEYVKMASMLPFGDEYNRIKRFAHSSGGRWHAQPGDRAEPNQMMDAGQAVRVAEFVMQWVGQDTYLALLRALGKREADRMREGMAYKVPSLRAIGFGSEDTHLLEKRYGVSQFASFIVSQQNRTDLIRAVARELHLQIDLQQVARVQDLKARLPCQQCFIATLVAHRELRSGLIFCSKNCQRQYHSQ